MSEDTLLEISGEGIAPYSARGLTQTLSPISGASASRRAANGDLVDLSVAQFRKFTSTISCTDQNVPALNGVWPGAILVVDCVVELAYKTVGGTPARPVVPGSSRVEGDYTFYRPRLTMMVINYSTSKDEWGATVPWSLELEEV